MADAQLVQRVNAGYVGTGQSAKGFVGKQATSTSVTTSVPITTVTTGKTLIVTDIVLTTDSAPQLDIQLQAAGVNIFRTFVRDLAPCNLPGIETQPSASSAQALSLLLPVTAGGVVNVIYTILGVEQ